MDLAIQVFAMGVFVMVLNSTSSFLNSLYLLVLLLYRHRLTNSSPQLYAEGFSFQKSGRYLEGQLKILSYLFIKSFIVRAIVLREPEWPTLKRKWTWLWLRLLQQDGLIAH